jgi:hypothetical protein
MDKASEFESRHGRKTSTFLSQRNQESASMTVVMQHQLLKTDTFHHS